MEIYKKMWSHFRMARRQRRPKRRRKCSFRELFLFYLFDDVGPTVTARHIIPNAHE